MSDTLDKLRDILSTEFDVERRHIQPEVTFEELGADSLDLLELGLQLEDEFDIEIGDDDRSAMTTVGDAVRLIDSKRYAE